MPVFERVPTSTAVVAAGWVNPTNAYAFDNNYAYSETNNAEQSYDYKSFLQALGGTETIDKVFVRFKWIYKLTGVATGDDATVTFSIKVYDGSTWTTYQVAAATFNCTTFNDEDFTDTDGDNSNSIVFIDVTSILNTHAKLNSAQTRLLTTLTADAGLTLRISVDCISLLVCYHIKAGAMYTGETAITKHSSPLARKALQIVEAYLTS